MRNQSRVGTHRGHSGLPHSIKGSTQAPNLQGPGHTYKIWTGTQVLGFLGHAPPPVPQEAIYEAPLPPTQSPGCSWKIGNLYCVSLKTPGCPILMSHLCSGLAHLHILGQEWDKAQLAFSSPPLLQPSAHQLCQQCLAQHLLLLGCEAGGELDVEEDEEIPFLSGVLRQWHPLTWHLLEVLGTETGEDERREMRGPPSTAL